MKHYFSVDVEADGLAPGVYSMLSIGAVYYRVEEDGRLSVPPGGLFEVNLKRIPGAKVSRETMDFWDDHPEAFAMTRASLVTRGRPERSPMQQVLHRLAQA